MPRSVPFAILLLAGRLVRPKSERTSSSQREGPTMLDYILIKTGINTLLARRDEEGASAVEYGLLVAGIAALIVAIVFLFGGMISERLHRHLHHRSTGDDAPLPPRLRLIQLASPVELYSQLHRVRSFYRQPARARPWEAPHVACEAIERPERRTSEDGASAVEYGLLLAGVAALIVAVVFLFGGAVAGPVRQHLRLGRYRLRRLDELRRDPVDLRPQTPALPRAQGCRAAPQRARVSFAPAHRGVASRPCTAPGPDAAR